MRWRNGACILDAISRRYPTLDPALLAEATGAWWAKGGLRAWLQRRIASRWTPRCLFRDGALPRLWRFIERAIATALKDAKTRADRDRGRAEDEALAARVAARRDEVKPAHAQPCNAPPERRPAEPARAPIAHLLEDPMPKHVPDVVTLYPHGPALEQTPEPPRALPMHLRPGTEMKLAERLARIARGAIGATPLEESERLARAQTAFVRRKALTAGAA